MYVREFEGGIRIEVNTDGINNAVVTVIDRDKLDKSIIPYDRLKLTLETTVKVIVQRNRMIKIKEDLEDLFFTEKKSMSSATVTELSKQWNQKHTYPAAITKWQVDNGYVVMKKVGNYSRKFPTNKATGMWMSESTLRVGAGPDKGKTYYTTIRWNHEMIELIRKGMGV